MKNFIKLLTLLEPQGDPPAAPAPIILHSFSAVRQDSLEQAFSTYMEAKIDLILRKIIFFFLIVKIILAHMTNITVGQHSSIMALFIQRQHLSRIGKLDSIVVCRFVVGARSRSKPIRMSKMKIFNQHLLSFAL